ncbi:hypothetical protein JCM9140_3626 [Halalkalibacter wakoensis JCM 9140]|uniref:Uncharacterized protein n=1 Tax=Halalkalibacter wakoensis JCM 9140 TaxID=1236970 RepID=W4Q728_9BACI|nr:hypothetical protein [Halalkalibacter wakoensis]GAE27478.1 hypothetical protein JCM9140_3626 [Halalkalibacter wakoensis JCM 9140]
MRFSEAFRLPDSHQGNFDFLNIRIDSDNRLFIDPTRINAEESPIFQRCSDIVNDFFHTIFDLYVEGKTHEVRDYFRSSGESNEIFLGLTRGFPRGLGNSEESLSRVFDYVHEQGLLDEQIVGRIEDFHVFVPDFGQDLLSDLVASLIKQELITYTQEQCVNHGINPTYTLTTSYWNHIEHNWEAIEELVPEYDGNPIVLIPKQIVVSGYLYNAHRYWQQVVSLWRQRVNREENTIIHQNRPGSSTFAPKKEIFAHELDNLDLTMKPYLSRMTMENRSMIEQFRNNIENTQRGGNSNKMSDEDIEMFIQNSYEALEEQN